MHIEFAWNRRGTKGGALQAIPDALEEKRPFAASTFLFTVSIPVNFGIADTSKLVAPMLPDGSESQNCPHPCWSHSPGLINEVLFIGFHLAVKYT